MNSKSELKYSHLYNIIPKCTICVLLEILSQFLEKFRENNVFDKEVTYKKVDFTNFLFSEGLLLAFLHTAQWRKNISSNHIFSSCIISKNVVFTKFLPKKRESKFP